LPLEEIAQLFDGDDKTEELRIAGVQQATGEIADYDDQKAGQHIETVEKV
jgi:hypothetical protein